jgi:alpha-tubulin suppressor-like RCC1 family protein
MTNREVVRLKIAILVVPLTLGLACGVKRDWSVCSAQAACQTGFMCTDASTCVPFPDAGAGDRGGVANEDVGGGLDGAPSVDGGGDFAADSSPDVESPDAPLVVPADAPGPDIFPDAPAVDTAPDVPPVDAPGSCSTDKDCSPNAPLCLGNQCAKCSSDNDCRSRAGGPACAASGLCVACTQNKHCAGSADAGADADSDDAGDGGSDGGAVSAPANLCDTTTNQCVECVQRSDCRGVCQACSAGACVAVKNQDDLTKCAGTCDDKGTCKSKQGQLCTVTTGGCLAGLFCSPDSTCCDTACTDSCMACDVQGHAGTCTVVTSGAPHSGHTGCGIDAQCMGTCNGRSDGKCEYPAAKTCGGGLSCSGPKLVGQSTCKQGDCVAPEGQLCSDGLNCAGDACKNYCTVAADCQGDYVCVGGSCHVKALSVAVGGESACAVFVDGKVRCWGGDSIGELGDGQTRPYGQSISVPAPVIGISNAKAIAGGYQHYCALLGDGTVRCWGANNAGQLGNGGYDTASTPTAVTGLAGVTATAIAGGGIHTCVLLSDSTIRCWGYNGSGQLGVLGGNPTTPQAPNLTGIKAVSAGGYHTCVIVSGGQVRCWGLNNNGQLGVATVSVWTIDPQTVTGLSDAATAISAGDSHTCALVADGTVWCWGGGNDGQLGIGDTNSSATPLSIYVAPAIAISATSLSTCALLATGTVSCWGKVMNSDDSGGGTNMGYQLPAVVTGTDNAIAVAAGERSCAVTQDGSILCWGWDYSTIVSPFTAAAVPVPGW